jgi:sRNA-binding regulator protein Hfq
MTNRKLIRPDSAELKKNEPSRAVRRKQNPPEQTNAEEFYYLKQMAAKTAMVVVLTSNEELRGWIEWYDKGAIKLNRNDGPNLLIPKHNIRYMFKEEELRRRVRRGGWSCSRHSRDGSAMMQAPGAPSCCSVRKRPVSTLSPRCPISRSTVCDVSRLLSGAIASRLASSIW